MRLSWLPRGKAFALLKLLETRQKFAGALRRFRPDLIHCHSLSPLWASVIAKSRTGARLLYDAHELETERNGLRGLAKTVDKWIERRLIRTCDAVVVVCDSIADWYEKEYGIERPVVVKNVPELQGGRPEPNHRLWRDRFGIPADHLVFIYQGGLFRGRRIEQLLRVFSQVKTDRHVVFMGYGEMWSMIDKASRTRPNIHCAPAVKPEEVLRHTAGADVGLVGVANVCLSYYYSLPNKLFEFLMAGIPALMPEYPEMVRLTLGSGCGWVVGEEDAHWVAAVDGLGNDQIADGKLCASALGARLSWQEEADKLIALYGRLLGQE